jgi:hypothetical protein
MTEEIGKNGIKIIPDLLISGGNGTDGSLNGLLGMQLLKMLGDQKGDQNQSN